MGKKRRREEEEEEEEDEEGDGPSTAELSSAQKEKIQRPKAKRRRREEEEDEREEEEKTEPYDEEVPLTNGHASKSRLNGYIGNGGEKEQEDGGEGGSGYKEPAYWLIRKPKNVSDRDLYNLRFSRKSKLNIQEFTVEDGGGGEEHRRRPQRFECRLERPTRALLHATSMNVASSSQGQQKPMMEPNAFLRGMAFIRSTGSEEVQMASSDGGTFLGNILESADIVEHLEFRPIRKQPRLGDEEELKERLKATGIGPVEKEEGGGEGADEDLDERKKKQQKWESEEA